MNGIAEGAPKFEEVAGNPWDWDHPSSSPLIHHPSTNTPTSLQWPARLFPSSASHFSATSPIPNDSCEYLLVLETKVGSKHNMEKGADTGLEGNPRLAIFLCQKQDEALAFTTSSVKMKDELLLQLPQVVLRLTYILRLVPNTVLLRHDISRAAG